ncbi:polysialyltransferase family glycosyltransferase [Pseudomonas segetis]|uniref:CDP-Glycerol:Poly(Glycerophosphate) glycerophosphotransferase n=1 Tax=Pseudomonas segetis TaxID=298908 RepID=A0A239A579_9PSED|nr:polysialyltransferase family glycosyltransferase [Pseudomonas segetis]SNR90720.1 hypothetical protein SAMN05216255_0915 [Pseudomonas segetis]
MVKYIIQFSTDFHLMVALAAIPDASNNKILMLGPRTSLAIKVASYLQSEFFDIDAREPKVTIFEAFKLLVNQNKYGEVVIVSPFVYPFFAAMAAKKNGDTVKSIVRTDEGIGSYASVTHYYTALRLEGQLSVLGALKRALAKKSAMWVTKSFRICKEMYLFKSDLTIDQTISERLRFILENLGLSKQLDNCVVYVSQPYVVSSFESGQCYADFIKLIAGHCGEGLRFIIKKHPRDDFDYESYGFDVACGMPLETYSLNNSVVFGFSSTALLMAKFFSNCRDAYFIKMDGFGPFYNNMSAMNRNLFDNYLKCIDSKI